MFSHMDVLRAIPYKKYICSVPLMAAGYMKSETVRDTVKGIASWALANGREIYAQLPDKQTVIEALSSNPGTAAAVVAGLAVAPVVVPRLVGKCKETCLKYSINSQEKLATGTRKENKEYLRLARIHALAAADAEQNALVANSAVPALVQGQISVSSRAAQTALEQLIVEYTTMDTQITIAQTHLDSAKDKLLPIHVRKQSLAAARDANRLAQQAAQNLLTQFSLVVQNTSQAKARLAANPQAAIAASAAAALAAPHVPQPDNRNWAQKQLSRLVDGVSQMSGLVNRTFSSTTNKVIAMVIPMAISSYFFPVPTITTAALGAAAYYSGVAEKVKRLSGRDVAMIHLPQVDFTNVPEYGGQLLRVELSDALKPTISKSIIPSASNILVKYSILRSGIQVVMNEPLLVTRLSLGIEKRLNEFDLFGENIQEIIKKSPGLTLEKQTALRDIALILRKTGVRSEGQIDRNDLGNLITYFDILAKGGLPNAIPVENAKRIKSLMILLELRCHNENSMGLEKIYNCLRNNDPDAFPVDMQLADPVNVVGTLAQLIGQIDQETASDVQVISADDDGVQFTNSPKIIIVAVPDGDQASSLDPRTYRTGQTSTEYEFNGTVSWTGNASTAHIKVNDWHHLNNLRNTAPAKVTSAKMKEEIPNIRVLVARPKQGVFTKLFS